MITVLLVLLLDVAVFYFHLWYRSWRENTRILFCMGIGIAQFYLLSALHFLGDPVRVGMSAFGLVLYLCVYLPLSIIEQGYRADDARRQRAIEGRGYSG